MIAYEDTGNGDAVTRHAYPTTSLLGDYLRAGAGLAPAVVLFATVPVGTVAATILAGFAAIFAVFGLRTALRHGTSLELDHFGLQAHGARRAAILWSELDRMKLAYYSTRRDRKSGWMQLELRAGGSAVSLDSRIVGFEQLVRCAAAAAVSRGIALSETTVANLEALGIRPPDIGGR